MKTERLAQIRADYAREELGVKFPVSYCEAWKFRGVGAKILKFWCDWGLVTNPPPKFNIYAFKIQELKKDEAFYLDRLQCVRNKIREYESKL